MIKLILIILFVLLSITILFFILTKNKQQMIQTYSISTFMGASTDNELLEPKQTIIEKINHFFDDNDAGDDGIDDGSDDAGE
ncbi:hypothetical protein MLOOGBEN_08150 [Bacillus sp. EB106-08-02-XG196]|uniref:hypothetical protein n=1 Tax=Bacillus sp. EB106-08-02-XG196 TaxID=2737049 RepID=UPI0015C42ADB|nr:hypothetical protein [Bacillus sp. EB106-08-02-XG196]NWQ40669.1 hypothetical protein [Bacillus sp. EB106-08-02-XG196]